MGKVAKQIAKIQIQEKLTLPQVFEKYPHLTTLQLEEVLKEPPQEEQELKDKLLQLVEELLIEQQEGLLLEEQLLLEWQILEQEEVINE